MRTPITLLSVILILTLLIQISPAQPEGNETLCIPGIVKCSRDGSFVCSGDGNSWNPCGTECSSICPESYTPDISIDEYIKEVNKRLKGPEEGYGFFGRISSYISNAFNGNGVYPMALGTFLIIIIIIIIYWRRMEG
jgi:hypothetical protein